MSLFSQEVPHTILFEISYLLGEYFHHHSVDADLVVVALVVVDLVVATLAMAKLAVTILAVITLAMATLVMTILAEAGITEVK